MIAIYYDDQASTVPDPGLVHLGVVDTGLDYLADAGQPFTRPDRSELRHRLLTCPARTDNATANYTERRLHLMRVAVMTAPGEVHVEDRPEPGITEPTDAIIRLSATCICGSDLWPYRGVETLDGPRPMGHEYAGIVEEVGSAVTTVRPGQFVVGSFFASDNTCEICRSGYQTSCVAP